MDINLLNKLIAYGYVQQGWEPASKGDLNRTLEKATLSLFAKLSDANEHQHALLDKNRLLSERISQLEHTHAKDKARMEELKRNCDFAVSSKQAVVDELASERKALQMARDDLTRSRYAIQAVRNAQKFQTEKNNREMSAVLVKLASSATSSGAGGGGIGQRDLLKDAFASLEVVRKSVVAENEILRKGIDVVIKETTNTLHMAGTTPSRWQDSCPDVYAHPEPHMTLPAESVVSFSTLLVEQLASRVAIVVEARETAEQEAGEAEATLAQERAIAAQRLTAVNVKLEESALAKEQLEARHQKALTRAEDKSAELVTEVNTLKDEIASANRKTVSAKENADRARAKLDKNRAKSDKKIAALQMQIEALQQQTDSHERAARVASAESDMPKPAKAPSTGILKPKSSVNIPSIGSAPSALQSDKQKGVSKTKSSSLAATLAELVRDSPQPVLPQATTASSKTSKRSSAGVNFATGPKTAPERASHRI